jgi:hypothetical protein
MLAVTAPRQQLSCDQEGLDLQGGWCCDAVVRIGGRVCTTGHAVNRFFQGVTIKEG